MLSHSQSNDTKHSFTKLGFLIDNKSYGISPKLSNLFFLLCFMTSEVFQLIIKIKSIEVTKITIVSVFCPNFTTVRVRASIRGEDALIVLDGVDSSALKFELDKFKFKIHSLVCHYDRCYREFSKDQLKFFLFLFFFKLFHILESLQLLFSSKLIICFFFIL